LRLSSINGEIDGGKNEEAQYILYRDTYSLQTTAHIYMKYTTKGILPAILLLYIVKCIAMHDAVHGVVWCLSVRLSVCPSHSWLAL